MIQLDDWTMCDKKLPNEDGLYLVTGVNGNMLLLDFYKDLPGFVSRNDEYGCYTDVTKYIVAWTKAPEAWKWKGDNK